MAATLSAGLPEWGQLDRRRIAALADLAPIARESGRRVGPRGIGGGRPVVRTILDLTALQASRRCRVFRDLRQRLHLAKQPTRGALAATAHKRLIALDAMLAAGAEYAATTAS